MEFIWKLFSSWKSFSLTCYKEDKDQQNVACQGHSMRWEKVRGCFTLALCFLPAPSCPPAAALSHYAGLWHYSPSLQQGCSSGPAGKQFMRKLSLEMQRSEQSKEEVLEKQALLLVNQKGRPRAMEQGQNEDAKWVKYLCRLGFSVDFVHRLGAGIDSMGKLLFHVLIGLGYFPNAKERITDCISICSKQRSFLTGYLL